MKSLSLQPETGSPRVLLCRRLTGGKQINIRLTMWSSKAGAPLLSLTTSTTSLEEPAVRLGCEALCTNLRKQHGGKLEVRAVYLDNPHRDGKGAKKLFELGSGIPGARRLFFCFLAIPIFLR